MTAAGAAVPAVLLTAVDEAAASMAVCSLLLLVAMKVLCGQAHVGVHFVVQRHTAASRLYGTLLCICGPVDSSVLSGVWLRFDGEEWRVVCVQTCCCLAVAGAKCLHGA